MTRSERYYQKFKSYEQRFWEKVNKDGPVMSHCPELGQCWQWMGGKLHYGHGSFWVRGKQFAAHRFSWEHNKGPIPHGLCVLHKCDNPPCVNPEHLFLGTQLKNIQDREEKGRTATGDRSGSRTHPESLKRGADNNKTKLTEAQVVKIREDCAGGTSGMKLAKDYGLSHSTIYRILNRTTWKHVP